MTASHLPAKSIMILSLTSLTTLFLLAYVSVNAHHATTSSTLLPHPHPHPRIRLIAGQDVDDRVRNSTSLLLLQSVLLDDYLVWHAANRHTARKLIFHLPKAQPGVGDRFAGLMVAYLNAVFSRRVLLLDWNYPFPISDYFQSHHDIFYDPARDAAANNSIAHCTVCKPHCVSSCPRGDLTLMLSSVHTVTFNTSLSTNMGDILMLISAYPRLQASKQLATLRADPRQAGVLYGIIMSRLLHPSKPFKTFMDSHATSLLRTRFISVHARLGSGVGESGPRFETHVPWPDLANCLAGAAVALADRLATERRLLLATDTPAFRVAFRHAVEKRWNGNVQVVGGDWPTKHLAKMKPAEMQDKIMFQLALVELMLLARGEALVSLKSRFADVAARLGGMDMDTHVVVNPVKHCVYVPT